MSWIAHQTLLVSCFSKWLFLFWDTFTSKLHSISLSHQTLLTTRCKIIQIAQFQMTFMIVLKCNTIKLSLRLLRNSELWPSEIFSNMAHIYLRVWLNRSKLKFVLMKWKKGSQSRTSGHLRESLFTFVRLQSGARRLLCSSNKRSRCSVLSHVSSPK